jgi:hypothetical protein
MYLGAFGDINHVSSTCSVNILNELPMHPHFSGHANPQQKRIYHLDVFPPMTIATKTNSI